VLEAFILSPNPDEEYNLLVSTFVKTNRMIWNRYSDGVSTPNACPLSVK
jgi:hypothetical protein